jgi:hypothetical protein
MNELFHQGARTVQCILVCGSRDWTSESVIWDALRSYKVGMPDDPLIIHGAARGADELAAWIAESMDLPVKAFPADWKTHGKRAGFLRNIQMLDENPDLVIAFQRNGSRGTQHTIDNARKRGIPVEVHTA